MDKTPRTSAMIAAGLVFLGALSGFGSTAAAADLREVKVPCEDVSGLAGAISAANTSGEPTTIILNPDAGFSCWYWFTGPQGGESALPPIRGKVTIKGGPNPGDRSSLQGPGESAKGIFQVDPGGELTLDSLTVSKGHRGEGGGAIYNLGTVTLSGDVSITYNSADPQTGRGGGVYNRGNLVMTSWAIVYQNTAGSGGGVFNDGGAVTFEKWASASKNTATVSGGGLYNRGGTITMRDYGSVTENTAGQNGGGVYNEGGTVTRTTSVKITGNTPDNCHGDAVPAC